MGLIASPPPSLVARLEEIKAHGTLEQQRAAVQEVDAYLRDRDADPVAAALKPGAPLEARPPRRWQRVLVALATGGPKEWRAEGLEPSCKPRLVMVVAGNQSGKSTGGGLCQAIHVSGRSARFRSPGTIWLGAPRLSDAAEIQRPYLSGWLGPRLASQWTPRIDATMESVLITTARWRARSKAYEQGDKAWQGKPIQAVYLDEQPTNDRVVTEAETRLVRHDGVMVVTMTGLHGTGGVLYRRSWEPWQDQLKSMPEGEPCAICGRPEREQWAEVSPGTWVVTAGMRSNSVSRGGVIPDERVDAKERELIAMGRPAEARVSVHGEWIEMAEDRLIPADKLRTFYPEDEPRAGYVEVVGWVDTASSTRSSADETAVAIWGRSADGLLYQLASEHGRWEPHEKLSRIIGVLAAHGCPGTWVDRQTGDMEFAAALNAELARRGHRPCVQVAETKTLDKVTVANLFAPMVASGQVLIRPEHMEGPESFGSQARLFSAGYRGHDDTLDAGMKAALKLVGSDGALYATAAKAMDDAAVKTDDIWDDDEDGTDWRMGSGMMGFD